MAAEDGTSAPDQHRHAVVVEAMPDAALVYDGAGIVRVANSRMLSKTGRAAEELVGHHLQVLMPPRLRESLVPRLHAFIDNPVSRSFGDGLTMSMHRADGTTVEVEIAVSVLRESEGTTFLMSARAVEDLSLDEIRFRDLLEASTEATLVLNESGRVVLCNTLAEKLFDTERISLFDRPVQALFVAHHATLVETLFEEALLKEVGQATGLASVHELEAVNEHGVGVPVEVSAGPLRVSDGHLVRLNVRDISERIRLHAEADRMKDEFLATVSHELRTPLTSVLGYAELLEQTLGGRDGVEGLDSDAAAEALSFLAVITRSARREMRLVEDLLTMVTVGSGALTVVPAFVNLRFVVLDAFGAAAPTARAADVSLSFVTDNSSTYVRGDADRLGQALDNLISNAVKFSPAGSQVVVNLRADGDVAAIEVCDRGPGIADGDMARVFERLYRGAEAVRGEKAGAGLGLAIVKAIIDAHHGKIEVDSNSEMGARFRIEIPLAPG